VVATDGIRVPLQAQKDLPTGRNGIKGTSHAGEVATRTILFGALLFPVSPLALMTGFKRGENAVLPEGKRFIVYVITSGCSTFSRRTARSWSSRRRRIISSLKTEVCVPAEPPALLQLPTQRSEPWHSRAILAPDGD